MKKSGPDSESHWENLLRKARADIGPEVNTAALLRSMREASVTKRESWLEEISDLFASTRVVLTCLAGAAAIALVTVWQVWETWQVLPWAEWLANATGGTL